MASLCNFIVTVLLHQHHLANNISITLMAGDMASLCNFIVTVLLCQHH
jgi:hypothetical protein